MYMHGNGVPQNYEKAKVWLKRASDQGLGSATVGLAVLFGMLQTASDCAEAHRLFLLGRAQGAEHAEEGLEVLEEQMEKDGMATRR